MIKTRILYGLCLTVLIVSCVLFGQNSGDFRTHRSGNWNKDSTWERFNGSIWVWPAPSFPDTLHATTIRSGDSVAVVDTVITYVGQSTVQAGGKLVRDGDTTVVLYISNGAMTVDGTLKQIGRSAISPRPYAITVSSTGSLVIGSGGVFQEDIDGGHVPHITWNDGSTLYITGIVSSTSIGGSPGESYYDIIWNCPDQVVNTNMGMHPGTNSYDTTTVIRGDLNILNTGVGRAQFSGPNAGTADQHQIARVIVQGNINVLDGSVFSAHGTSKAYTDIYVTVLGNITVRDSVYITGTSSWQFSSLAISRGSQGGYTGTTIWYLKGDVYYGRKTGNQNSSDHNTEATMKGKFVFCKDGTQVVTLNDSIAWSGECNMQFGDSVTATTIEIGNSPFGGSACSQRIKDKAKVIVGPNGYIGGGTNSNSIASNFAMDNGATLVIASPNGIRATGRGNSGAVRVSGDRNYNTGANFEYNGIALQRLGSGFPASANNLTINNPAGAYADSVSAITIDGTLTLSSGDLDLGTCPLTLGPAGLLGETPGNTCIGTVDVTRTVATGVEEPFGNVGLVVNPAGDAPGVTTVTRVTGAYQTGNWTRSILRSFDIAPAHNLNLNSTLDFYYDASELDGQNAATMELYKSTDGGSTWESQLASNNPGEHKLSVTGVNSFSIWTAADGRHALMPVTRPYTMDKRWNIISVPLRVLNDSVAVLFPTATSQAYAYATGYQQRKELDNGVGYWLKFGYAQDVPITGGDRYSDTIDVLSGWNMIGSLSEPTYIGDVGKIPPEMTLSLFYGYRNGYNSVDSLKPGKGYWIKTSVQGQLVLQSGTGMLKGGRSEQELLNGLSWITVKDKDGNSSTLYIGTIKREFSASRYELPPPPPEGIFDVRFSSQRFVETYAQENKSDQAYPVELRSLEYPITVSWGIKDAEKTFTIGGIGLTKTSIRQTLAGNGSIIISEPLKSLVLTASDKGALPKSFSLGENYPNPFNPATKFVIAVPEISNVEVIVYDIMGRKVRTILNKEESAGYHTLEWNGLTDDNMTVTSGIYFVRMMSGKFNAVQKIMMMK